MQDTERPPTPGAAHDAAHPARPTPLVFVLGLPGTDVAPLVAAVASAAGATPAADAELDALCTEALAALGRTPHSLADFGRPWPEAARLQPWLDRAVTLLAARRAAEGPAVLHGPTLLPTLPLWQAACQALDAPACVVLGSGAGPDVAATGDESLHAACLWLADTVAALAADPLVVDTRLLRARPDEQRARLAARLGAASSATRARGRHVSAATVRRDATDLGAELLAAEALLGALAHDAAPAAGARADLDDIAQRLAPALQAWGRSRQQLVAAGREPLARDNRELRESLRAHAARLAELEGELQRTREAYSHARYQLVQINARWQAARRSLWGRIARRAGEATRLFRGRGLLQALPREPHLVAPRRGGWPVAGGCLETLLIAERPWSQLGGWYWLVLQFHQGRAERIGLDHDLGQGFAARLAFEVDGATLRLPLAVAPGVSSIGLRLYSRDARLDWSARLEPARRGDCETVATPAMRRVWRRLGLLDTGEVSLAPHQQLQPSSDPALDWFSSGIDPQFMVHGPSLPAGCYRIELSLDSPQREHLARVYFDVGRGFEESLSAAIAVSCGRPARRIVRLPEPSRQIRFDPTESHGPFSVESLRFVPVAADRALREMAETVAASEGLDAAEQTARVQELVDSARDPAALARLETRYAACFRARSAGHALAYPEWLRRHGDPAFADPQLVADEAATFVLRPLISVLMPVYDTPLHLLRRAVASVQAQSYRHWELCIADDASPREAVRTLLAELAAAEPRIKLALRERNGHISAATNSALALAQGEFVALLDHDDELSPHALHHVVAAINARPSAAILYSDEDKIDGTGERFEPHFKPDWNPDLLHSQNYVSHLGVYRTALVRELGGLRVGYEGSQDYDLLLRCAERVDPADIVHIPKILYHWRMVDGSTAGADHGKSYTAEAGLRALQDHLARCHPGARVEHGGLVHTYRVRWPLPEPAPLVSLLMPTRDQLAVTRTAVESILTLTTYPHFELLILDNQSAEPETLAWFAQIAAQDPRVRVLRWDHPFNYSAINNFGARESKGSVLALVNNDVEVISPDWLDEMVSHALRPDIGCVGAKLHYGDGTLQHAGVILGLGGVAGHSHKHFPGDAPGYFRRLQLVQNLSAVTAACLVVRREVFARVGGLDEEHLTVAFNDVDFCLKVQASGLRNLWTPHARLYHHESLSRGAEDNPLKVARFNREVDCMKRRWGALLAADPSYNPNLTTASENFALK